MNLGDRPLKIEGETSGTRIIDSLYKSGDLYYFLDTGWTETSTHPAHCIGKLVDVDGDRFIFEDDKGRDFYVSPINDKDVAWGEPMIEGFYGWKKHLKEKYPNADGAGFVKRDQGLTEIETINNIGRPDSRE